MGGDTWYFYFDPNTSALVGYRFYHDESANDGEYILLEGEFAEEGLRLPRLRTWYTNAEDRLLGKDTLTSLAGCRLVDSGQEVGGGALGTGLTQPPE